MIGGLLCRPATKFDAFRDSQLFMQFPYGKCAARWKFRSCLLMKSIALQALVTSAVLFITFVGVLLFLPETMPKKDASSTTSSEIELKEESKELDETVGMPSGATGVIDENDVPAVGGGSTATTKTPMPLSESETTSDAADKRRLRFPTTASKRAPPLLNSSSDEQYQQHDEDNGALEQQPSARRFVVVELRDWDAKRRRVLVFKVLALFVLFRFVTSAKDETMPLWLMTDMAHGGAQFDSSQVGYFLSCNGAFLLIGVCSALRLEKDNDMYCIVSQVRCCSFRCRSDSALCCY
jgi:hypothetical protein